jgi:mannosyltransferase
VTTSGTSTPGLASGRTVPAQAGEPARAGTPAAGGRASGGPPSAPRPLDGPWPTRLAVPLLPAAGILALGLWRLDGRGPWRDEAATYQVAQRSWAEIGHLLQHLDAVHGLYYLLMHTVFAVFGAGPAALRMPAVICMAAAAAGVALIGRRLSTAGVGLAAGLLFAVTPFASRYAQEGRSYALVTAGAVGATWLLLRAWERPTAGRWAGYGAAVLLTGLLHEFSLLLLPAHGATVLLARRPGATRRVRISWLLSAGAAVLGTLPLVLYSRAQSAQVDWLPPVTWTTPWDLARHFAGPRYSVMAVVLGLALLGLAFPGQAPGPVRLRALALPWLVLPPALLMAASLVTPLYYDRYVLYSLPGLLLLAAAGLDACRRAAAQLLPQGTAAPVRAAGRSAVVGVLGAALAAGLLAVQLPAQRHNRTPLARADDFRAAAAAFRLGARPGDAVVFVPRNRRAIEDVYPRDFEGTVDALQIESPTHSGTLVGVEAPPKRFDELLRPYRRVWLVGANGRYSPAGDPRARELLRVLGSRFQPTGAIAVPGFFLQLYVHS